MASTTASVGNESKIQTGSGVSKDQIAESLGRLSGWLEKNDYRGYDTFDGLNAKYARSLTFETNFLRTVLQQGVRRFPINLRPILAIPKSRSTKGMGYLAKGFMRLQHATGEKTWGKRQRLRCNGWWKTNPQVTRAPVGAITSIINQGVFICRRECRRSSGPR